MTTSSSTGICKCKCRCRHSICSMSIPMRWRWLRRCHDVTRVRRSFTSATTCRQWRRRGTRTACAASTARSAWTASTRASYATVSFSARRTISGKHSAFFHSHIYMAFIKSCFYFIGVFRASATAACSPLASASW